MFHTGAGAPLQQTAVSMNLGGPFCKCPCNKNPYCLGVDIRAPDIKKLPDGPLSGKFVTSCGHLTSEVDELEDLPTVSSTFYICVARNLQHTFRRGSKMDPSIL